MSSGEDLSWIPATCGNGHSLDPHKGGGVSLSWVSCTCRPGSHGHHIAFCRIEGCKAEPRIPPGCPGVQDQR